ncbi:Hypothetical protein HDN1F_09360 [gamma proteobacterium HdN1]|nr:Hypothetical protein HDN1F_09360 [gamma proteobacterium HdN1]
MQIKCGKTKQLPRQRVAARGGWVECQRGQSSWGNIVLVLALIFFALTMMKLWSPYYDDFAVSKALENMGNESGTSAMSATELRDTLNKKLQISGVELKKEDVVVDKSDAGVRLNVTYERRVPLYGNIDAAIRFHHELQIKNEGR